LEKRKNVQTARRRSDDEIIKLFHIPYRSNFSDSSYEEVQRELVRLFQLDRRFGDME